MHWYAENVVEVERFYDSKGSGIGQYLTYQGIVFVLSIYLGTPN